MDYQDLISRDMVIDVLKKCINDKYPTLEDALMTEIQAIPNVRTIRKTDLQREYLRGYDDGMNKRKVDMNG